MDNKIILTAIIFASQAHEGQKRKYTGERYFNHPKAVAEIVGLITDDENMIVAALLHDTVEDTEVTIEQIRNIFGDVVAQYVDDLTDKATHEDGNRAARKMLEKQRLSQVCRESKTIKLADLIDNTKSIVEHDPNFAKVYMREKKALLEVLKEGDQELYKQAMATINEYYREEAEMSEEKLKFRATPHEADAEVKEVEFEASSYVEAQEHVNKNLDQSYFWSIMRIDRSA